VHCVATSTARGRLALGWPVGAPRPGRAELPRDARPWLTIERLPAYAPELNPVEALWGNVKGQECANLYAPDRLGLV
jgi:DDE superfamily endonuclease